MGHVSQDKLILEIHETPCPFWKLQIGFRDMQADESKTSNTFVTTLWWTNIAMENGPFVVDFPIKNGDFPLLC